MGDHQADARRLAIRRKVLVIYDDAREYRGAEDDLDPVPMERHVTGWLSHLTDRVAVLVHDRDVDGDDVYASVIPKAVVKRLVYLKEEED